MGMPVNRLKLMAFAFGAAVAALTGTFATALNGSVFPQNFEFPLLITVYTMVILGGAGSQAGVVLGAVIVSVLLEALREPGDARGLFYVVMLLALVAFFRTSWKLVVVLGGTIVVGLVARLVAGGIDDSWTAGPVEESGRIAAWASDWVIVPDRLAEWVGPASYIALVALGLLLTLVRGWTRIAVLVPTLYLGAFVWENVLLVQPESTRYIILGALLVAMMVARPAGTPRREARGDRVTRLLDLQGVSMAFGGLRVVDELDLHVDEGEIVSVIGPNGAGQDDALQSRHGRLRPDRRGDPVRGRVASRGSTRTASRAAGSRARSRRFGSSST